MNLRDGDASELRFAAYVEGLASVIAHADRSGPLRGHITGPTLPGERKSGQHRAPRTAPALTSAQPRARRNCWFARPGRGWGGLSFAGLENRGLRVASS